MLFLRFVWPGKAWPCFSYRRQEMPQLAQTRMRERSFLGKGWNSAAGDTQTTSAVPAKSPAPGLQPCPFVCPSQAPGSQGTCLCHWTVRQLRKKRRSLVCSDIRFLLLPAPFLRSSSLSPCPFPRSLASFLSQSYQGR